MNLEWFLAKNGVRIGPLSIHHLKQLIAAGQVLPSDMVLMPGEQQWVTAGSLSNLFPPQAPPATFWERRDVKDSLWVVAALAWGVVVHVITKNAALKPYVWLVFGALVAVMWVAGIVYRRLIRNQ
jgi:hypothetical protein